MTQDSFSMLLENYSAFIKKIDRHIAALEKRYPHEIACKKGCDACCKNLTLFPVEAFCLSLAFSKLKKTARNRVVEKINAADGTCPLLIDSACALYENRPVICRTHGYPIYMEQDGHRQIDFCPDNFKNITSFGKQDLLNIEQLNATLLAINNHFLSCIDTDSPLPDRIDVGDGLFLLADD